MSRLSSSRSRSASMMTGTVGSSVTESKRRFLKRTSSFSESRNDGRRVALLVEEAPHGRQELLPREGLGDVVVGADLHAGDQVPDLALDREHRDRDLPRLGRALQGRADLPARELRHHDVEQDQVRLAFDRLLDALAAVAGEHGGVPRVVEDRLDDEKDVFVIVDDENLARRPSVLRELRNYSISTACSGRRAELRAALQRDELDEDADADHPRARASRPARRRPSPCLPSPGRRPRRGPVSPGENASAWTSRLSLPYSRP